MTCIRRARLAGRYMLPAILVVALCVLVLVGPAHADPTFSWGPPSAVDPQPSGPTPNGVANFDGYSCPSSGFCAVTDGRGDVVTSTDPTGGVTAWNAAWV